MLSLSHSATGAAIATLVPNPVIAYPLILASHYFEDYVLHWDVGTGLSNGHKHPRDAFKHEFIDLGLSLAFIYIVFQSSHTGINYQAWMGAAVALIPDFLEAPRNFWKWEPTFLKPINNFHARFHHSTRNILLGLAPQIALLLIILSLAK